MHPKIVVPLLILLSIYVLYQQKQKSFKSAPFNSKNVESITHGMNLGEVIEELGTPFSVKINDGNAHTASCFGYPNSTPIVTFSDIEDIKMKVRKHLNRNEFCCEINAQDTSPERITLIYSKPTLTYLTAPRLWVHLNNHFETTSVYAKKNDRSIYSSEFGARDKELFRRCFD